MAVTREELDREYGIDSSGRIQAFGKFEGQMAYVPYFWDVYLDGGAARDDGRVLGFDVTAEDKAMFPELKRRRTVRLIEDSQGFVIEV